MTKKSFLCGMVFVLTLTIQSCDNIHDAEVDKSSPRISSVSQRIGQLKDAGLFDQLLNAGSGRSASDSGLGDIDVDGVTYFINNTDEALAEIAQQENGDIQLRLIEAMFTGGTVGEIADIMAEISEDMASGYLDAVETQMTVIQGGSENARAVSSTGITDVRSIKLCFFDETQNETLARGIFPANLNDSTIAFYVGFCVATISGVIAYSCWIPWVKFAGAAVAIAGGVSMVAQLSVWYVCTDFKSFCNAIIPLVKDHNVDSLQTLVNSSSVSGKFLTIGLVTASTVTTCAFSSLGQYIIGEVSFAWNLIAKYVSSLIPSWFTIKGNGIWIFLHI